MKSGDPKIFKDAKEHRCPILTKDELGNYRIRLNTATGRCEGLTEEAKQALTYINHCLEKNVTMHAVSLSHGDTLLVNNTQTLHGRASFDAKEGIADGEERWVLRKNLTENNSVKTR
jgi:alpha-ketoglutarate-dependent taurine dioxygenase